GWARDRRAGRGGACTASRARLETVGMRLALGELEEEALERRGLGDERRDADPGGGQGARELEHGRLVGVEDEVVALARRVAHPAVADKDRLGSVLVARPQPVAGRGRGVEDGERALVDECARAEHQNSRSNARHLGEPIDRTATRYP